MSNSGFVASNPHVALLPSAGMGHLTPFIRLAGLLVHHRCRVTFIVPHPTVSLAESQLMSRFFSAFPQVSHKQFHVLPIDPSSANSNDPFFLWWEAARRSAHLLSPLLSSLSPPLSALVTDISLISSVIPITRNLHLPNYVLVTSSARMFSLFAYLPTIYAAKPSSDFAQLSDIIEISGISPIPRSSMPPALLNSSSLFATIFMENGRSFTKVSGAIINTFEELENDSLMALNCGMVIKGLPPLYAIGPFAPCGFERGDSREPLRWLDEQPERSVVYVCFGSRTTMSRDQMRQLGNGLIRSGYKFMWVLKDKKVDKEDEEGLDKVIGDDELMERIKEKGMVVKEWVDQGEILGHRAVGGFLSHCGWNSVVEAAWHGVRVLAWPQHGDQKINAEVVERIGLGLWWKSLGWAEETVVSEYEIEKSIKEMMESDVLRVQAAKVGEEARKATGVGGSSEIMLKKLIQEWNNTDLVE